MLFREMQGGFLTCLRYGAWEVVRTDVVRPPTATKHFASCGVCVCVCVRACVCVCVRACACACACGGEFAVVAVCCL